MRRAPLWPDRVLGDLDQHGVAGLQRVLDPALLALEVDGFPVDFTGVEHGVAAASDVDEGGFHGRQHVLDLAQVDVADQGILLGLRDEVLGQDAVLEDADLDSVVALADDHLAVHGFAPGQELGLGDDGAAAAGIAGFAAALLLRLKPGGALEGRDAVVDRAPRRLHGVHGRGSPCWADRCLPRRSVPGPGRHGGGDGGGARSRRLRAALGAFFCFFRVVPVAFGRSLSAPDSLSDPRLLRPRRPRLRRRRRLPASSPSPSSPSSSSASATAAAGRCRAHDGGQVGGLEDHRGDRSRLQEQRGGGGGCLGRRFCCFCCCGGTGLGCVLPAASGGCPLPGSRAASSAAGASAAGASAAGASATGAAALARLARRRTGFSTGTSAASAAGASAAGGRGRGFLGEGRQGFGRFGDLAGAGAAGGCLGLGFGGREPSAASAGTAATAICCVVGRRCRVRCVRGGFLLRKGLAAGPDRPLRRRGYSSFAASAASSATRASVVARYNLVIIHMWRHSCP